MDEVYLIARIKDAIRLSESTNTFKYVGFLSVDEASYVRKMPELKKSKHTFFGGYEDAERVCFVALPEWCDSAEDLGIVDSYTISYRNCDKLSHRDFLGTLMSFGITRETIGDILCEEGRTVIFVLNSVSKYVKEQIDKVGGVGVSVTEGVKLPLPGSGKLIDCTETVSSLRIDCVIAALLNTSRENAKKAILDNRVLVDSQMCEKITATVNENSKISVKGVGKFIIKDTSSHSKKGKIIINFSKYS